MEIAPYNLYAAVTPSDTVNFVTQPEALYVGGAGNLVAVLPDNTTVTFTGVTAGSVLPIRCKRVNNTNTTATAIVALNRT